MTPRSCQAKPFFSVIIPTYNRVEGTMRAVQSVLAQTFRDFEVIVIDDGSKVPFHASPALKKVFTLIHTAHSLKQVTHHPSGHPYRLKPSRHGYKKLGKSRKLRIAAILEGWTAFLSQCRDYVLRLHLSKKIYTERLYLESSAAAKRRQLPCSQIKVLHLKRNWGVAAARNLGIRQAQGQWIALLDSDDSWHEEKLAKQAAYMIRHPSLKVLQADEHWVRGGKRVNRKEKHHKRGGYIFKECLEACLITPSTAVLRRDLFQELGYFNEGLRVCEDYELWIRISAHYPVGFLDEMLATRYQKSHGAGEQLSLQYPVMDLFRIRALKDFIACRAGNRNPLISPSQYHLACEMLVKKCSIVLAGARKRRRYVLAWRLKRLMRWSIRSLNDLEADAGESVLRA